MDAETIQLILDLRDSGASVEEVARKLEELQTAAKAAADTYEVLDGRAGAYDLAAVRQTEAVRDGTRATREAAAAARTLADPLEELARREAAVAEAAQRAAAAQKAAAEAARRAAAEAAAPLELVGATARRQVDSLEALAVHVEHVGAAAGRAGGMLGRSGDFGRGMLQASFMVQDFTSMIGDGGLARALMSVQNNIPMLLTGLGAGAGLAGIVSVVSVGVGLLVSNWDSLTARWKDGETEREAERMKRLAKETESAQQAAEKLYNTHPREQREEESVLKKAVDEFGGLAVQRELSEALKARFGDFGAAANEAQARTFLTNLMRGDRKAFGLLGDLDLRGDIGEVLRGGPTPRERQQAVARAQDRQNKERAQHEKERKEAEEKAAKEAEAEHMRQIGANAAEGERRGKQAAEAREKARKQQAADAGAAHRRNLGAALDTDIDERAAAELAGMRAAGGFVGPRGQFVRAGPDRQNQELLRLIDRELARRFPNMGRAERQTTAFGVTQEAKGQLNRRMEQARAQAMDAGLDAVQATQQAMAQTIGELRQIAERARMLQQNARALKQHGRTMSTPGMPTN